MSSQAQAMVGTTDGARVQASYERFASFAAILAGVAGVLYSITFVVLAPRMTDSGNGNLAVGLYSLFLMLGGLFSSAALVGLYARLRETEASFALWGLLLAMLAALGSVIHGGYDLANAFNPPGSSTGDFPNQIDPRGLLTFGISGIGLFVLSWLMSHNRTFPRGLALLGYLLAALLVIIYIGRLIVLDPKSYAILLPAALAGLIVNPAWYIWLGLALRKRE